MGNKVYVVTYEFYDGYTSDPAKIEVYNDKKEAEDRAEYLNKKALEDVSEASERIDPVVVEDDGKRNDSMLFHKFYYAENGHPEARIQVFETTIGEKSSI